MGEKLNRVSFATSGWLAVLTAAVLSLSIAGPAASQQVAKATTTPPYAAFTLSSFNVLGSSHTPAGGKWAPGTTRIKWVTRLLTRYTVDVVGFQEMQGDQLTKFLDLSQGSYAVYPGFELREQDSDNSIAWRTDMWDLVKSSTVEIPYFDGNLRPMPVVLLRNKATGITAYFANFHNPATNRQHPHQGRYRKQAITDEIALANQLRKTGVPVFITGDMNERDPVYCRMTGETRLKAARGGTNKAGVCDAGRPRAVDWIFGTKRLTFDNYIEDRSKLLLKTSDHPMIVTGVGIDGAKFPKAITDPSDY
jgi:Endonuclease/Exonuclease/phosphatase family